MSRDNDGATTKKQLRKTVYLDALSLDALEYLRTLRPKGAFRFSSSILMHEMLAHWESDPIRILDVEGHASRSDERGRPLCIPITDQEAAAIERLSDYYRERATDHRRVRDGVPKLKRLPLSRLFAAYLREYAGRLGWRPEGE